MHRATRLAAALLAFLAVQTIQCGSDDTDPADGAGRCGGAVPAILYPDEQAGDDAGPVASDEALERVWDRRCRAERIAGAAAITSPAQGSTVSRAEFSLAWEQTIAAAPARSPAPAAKGPALPRLSFGIREAAAHLPPVTGWVYLVEVRQVDRPSIWVFTTRHEWRPDPVARAGLGTGPVTVQITSAYLRNNVVEEGPWLGEERSFEVVE